MNTYDTRGDIAKQPRDYLGIFLVVGISIGIWVFGVLAARQTLRIEPWLAFGAGMVLTNLFRRFHRDFWASVAFIGGLMGMFAIDGIQSGPHAAQMMLMLVPVILSCLLFDIRQVITIGVIAIGLMLVTATINAGLAEAIGASFVPAILCTVLLTVWYVNDRNARQVVFCATDIQQKDTQRAEMFYDQSEKLREALRQLTHANSSLELMNRKLEEAQARAERASDAKSVFLSNMSHELRTPLNVIIGYTSTILDMPGLYENVPLPPVYKNDIRLIKNNGYYLLGLINDILDLSKIEAGRLELHCAPVDLPDMLQGCIATSIGLVKDKPIQIRSDFPDDLPRVWADPMRARQIVLNLMSNAIKFTRTGSVTLRAALNNGQVEIAVIDTGIGIPDKALEHIFDRFQQAEHDTDRHYGGTGLGLDISRRLAIMHGGELTVQSEIGRGSTFAFTLPLFVDQVEPSQEAPDSATGIKPLQPVTEGAPALYSILVAEDEASMRDMMRRALEGVGHVVVEVQDGADVLDVVTGILPDVIILDVCLPNVDGWQILARLKQDAETASIPVIVATASDDEDHAMQLGATLYLRKPFSSDELIADVQELLPHSLGTGAVDGSI